LSYIIAYLISQTISAMVGVLCWERRRQATGAGAYALVAFSQAAWTFANTAQRLSESLEAKLLWDAFQFLCAGGTTVAFAVFTLLYTKLQPRVGPLPIAFLSIPFVSLLLFSLTERWQHLVRLNARLVESDFGPRLFYEFGPAVWGATLFGYTLYLVALGLLAARYLRGAIVFRRQVGLVLFGVAVPLIGSAISMTLLVGYPGRDLTPFTFAIANVIVAWALVRWRLFDLIPVAKDAVVASLGDAVFVVDTRGRILDMNPSALRMAGGVLRDDVIGRKVHEFFAEWPVLVAQLARKDPTLTIVDIQARSGQTRHIELQSLSMQVSRAREGGRVIVARDVTERIEAQDELRRHRFDLEALVEERTAELKRENARNARLEAHVHQSQKMEAMGRLAGQVAHDFNNLLTVIMGSAEELARAREPKHAESPEVNSILQASRQAAALTKQLLGLSRKEVLNPRPLDLNEVLHTMEPMLRLLVTANVELVVEADPRIGRVMADPSRMQQVVMNLALNARDASPEGGRIRIVTAEVARTEIDPLPPPAADAARFVALRVIDNGVGMDAATRERALEPFFTTKEAGKGTGLGLAIVQSIVEQSGGVIDIDSEVGKGTTITVYIPRIQDDDTGGVAAKASPAPAAIGAGRASKATILVVEDDAAIRTFLERQLRDHGYDVLSADGGDKALDVAAHAGGIHLLITDIHMPGMNGRELATRLTSVRPGLPVLYVSGYADEVIAPHGVLDPGVNFLQKPFTHDALLRMVGRLLA